MLSLDDFSSYELRVLKWIRDHPIPEEQFKAKAPKRYLKTILFLIRKNALIYGPEHITLSQPALDALAQYRELFWVNLWHNFWLGFVTGILTGVLVTLLFTWLL